MVFIDTNHFFCIDLYRSIFGSSVSDMGISTSMSASMSEEFKLSIVKQATLDVQGIQMVVGTI